MSKTPYTDALIEDIAKKLPKLSVDLSEVELKFVAANLIGAQDWRPRSVKRLYTKEVEYIDPDNSYAMFKSRDMVELDVIMYKGPDNRIHDAETYISDLERAILSLNVAKDKILTEMTTFEIFKLFVTKLFKRN